MGLLQRWDGQEGDDGVYSMGLDFGPEPLDVAIHFGNDSFVMVSAQKVWTSFNHWLQLHCDDWHVRLGPTCFAIP